MTSSQRAGEITFYEELGLAPDASPQEVRDTFRALVRLLHPDQQTDPQLKHIAEKQMRKLNRIYAVLADPERRRRYDKALDGESPPPVLGAIADPVFRQSIAKIAWTAATLVSAALLIWLAWENTPGTQIHARDQNAPPLYPAVSVSQSGANSADQSSLITRLESDLRAVTLERDAAIHEITRLRAKPALPEPATPTRSERTEIGLPVLTATELPSAAGLPAFSDIAPSRIESPPNRKFAGFWFYAVPGPGQRNKNKTLYPPEYIETTIKEENGTLHGKYVARFQIADRAISPDVNFTFTGASTTGTETSFSWTGAAGARGEVTLKLLSGNSLRIDWNAIELGTQQGLDSGTAILTRRIE